MTALKAPALIIAFLGLIILSMALLLLPATARASTEYVPVQNLTGYQSVYDVSFGADWNLYTTGVVGSSSEALRNWSLETGTYRPIHFYEYLYTPRVIEYDGIEPAIVDCGESVNPPGWSLCLADRSFASHTIEVVPVQGSPKSIVRITPELIAMSLYNGSVVVYSIASHSVVQWLVAGAAPAILVATPGYLASLSDDGVLTGVVTVWDAVSWSVLFTARHQYLAIRSATFDLTSGQFFYLESNDFVHAISLAARIETYSTRVGQAKAIAFDEGTSLVLVCGDGGVLVGLRPSDGVAEWQNSSLAQNLVAIYAKDGGSAFALVIEGGSIQVWALRADPWYGPKPLLRISNPPDGAALSPPIIVTGTVQDPGSTEAVLISLDGVAVAIASGIADWRVDLTEFVNSTGYHEIVARVLHRQFDLDPVRIGVFVEIPPPALNPLSITIAYPLEGSAESQMSQANGSIFNATIDVTLYGHVDNEAWIPIAVNGTKWTLLLPRQETRVGNHTLEIIASDSGGRFAAASVIFFIEHSGIDVDDPPIVAITAPRTSAQFSPPFVVRGISSDDGNLTLTRVRVDNNTWSSSSPLAEWEFEMLAVQLWPGNHTIWAEVQDSGGQRDLTAISVRIPEPYETPTIRIFSLEDGQKTTHPVSLRGIVTGHVTSDVIRILIDGSLVIIVNSSSEWAVSLSPSDVSLGTHVLRAELVRFGSPVASDNLTITIEPPSAGATQTAPDPFVWVLVISAIAITVVILRVIRTKPD